MIKPINKFINELETRKSDLILPLFGMIFIAANIATNIFALRLISLSFDNFSFIVGGGIFIFPLTFFTLDTITEHYGFNKAILIIIFNIFVLLLTSVTFWYTLNITPNNQLIEDSHYQIVLSPFLRSFFATASSNIVGYVINCVILDKLKFYFNGKWMIFRLIFATTIAEIIYSLIWNLIYMSGHVSLAILSQIVGSNFIVKVFFQILSTPITYLIVIMLRKIDERQSIRISNPFLDQNSPET